MMRLAPRVLLVEDYEDARELYAITLQLAGIEVRAVADAAAGLAVAQEWLPDVVVTDYILGGPVTGADLCRRLRENPATRHIPALVMTGSTRKADAEAVLGAGCADIRIKPYLPDQLIADVRRLTQSGSLAVRSA
jgi:CheY-like chemotaxis protein